MKMRRLMLISAVAVCTVALWSCTRLRSESETGTLLFPHALHVEQADCSTCHEGIAENTGGATGAYIPKKPTCANCHDVEDEENCSTCHKGPKEGVRFTKLKRHLNFSHAGHSEQVEDCATCHPKDAERGALIPGHPTCNAEGCHARTYSTLQCRSCHQNLRRYRLEPLSQLRHGPNFANEHGTLARQFVRACAQCHDQTYCAECHAAHTAPAKPSILFPDDVEAEFIHRGNFVARHAIEARSAPQSCRKCHGQRHCRACHALNGVAVAPHQDLSGGKTRDYHPSGWMSVGSPRFHGTKARLDINRCASCHDRGASSNCVSCHSVGGIGGNPHPPGWSWRDKDAQCRTAAMCATCHPNGRGCP
jgi:c(7)-type cytochrome triheme protein